LASLWQRATQLQQELKNDDRSEDYLHMAYVQDTTDIAQWIQSNTDAYPATKAWANTWLSNNPPSLIHAIESLKIALSIKIDCKEKLRYNHNHVLRVYLDYPSLDLAVRNNIHKYRIQPTGTT
jgi:hypothetical protein